MQANREFDKPATDPQRLNHSIRISERDNNMWFDYLHEITYINHQFCVKISE